MNKGIRFTDEFKRDAVAQVVERGYAVSEVAERLGIIPSRCTRGSRSFQSHRMYEPRFWIRLLRSGGLSANWRG
jgi:transposase-like protein